MRIAYVVSGFPRRSETFIYREVLGLRALGLDVQVFAVRPPPDAELASMDPRARALAAKVHYLSRRETAQGLARAAATSRGHRLNLRLHREATLKPNPVMRLARAHAIAALVRAGGYQRVHAHWSYSSQLAALVHELTGVPTSISVHAHEVGHEHGHFPAVFEHIDLASFCNAAAMRRLLELLPPSAAALCELHYHGVDLEAFPVLPPPPLPPPLRVVSAGRLTRTKGHDRLLRAIHRAVRAGVDVHLTLVGDGAERAAIETLARELGLAERLTITGWIPHDQVRDHLARSHVFALCADVNFHDGLPNVAVESMAVGRPVILSPLPAASEAVTPGVEGFLLSRPGAEDELVAHLERLAAQPELAGRMGSAARARVERDFDERIHLRALADRLCARVSPAASAPRAAAREGSPA